MLGGVTPCVRRGAFDTLADAEADAETDREMDGPPGPPVGPPPDGGGDSRPVALAEGRGSEGPEEAGEVAEWLLGVVFVSVDVEVDGGDGLESSGDHGAHDTPIAEAMPRVAATNTTAAATARAADRAARRSVVVGWDRAAAPASSPVSSGSERRREVSARRARRNCRRDRARDM
jgi:hypothetical protein